MSKRYIPQPIHVLLDNAEHDWATILPPDAAKSARRQAARFAGQLLQAVERAGLTPGKAWDLCVKELFKEANRG